MGLYSNLGRVLGALLSLAMPGIAIWQCFNLPCFQLALYVGFSGALVALIELPILCSCNKYCQTLAQYTRILGSLWIVRAGIYIGIAAGGFAIYQVQGFKPGATMDCSSYLLVPLVLLVLNSLLYIAAIYKKEDPPGGAAPKPATPTPAAGGSVTSMFAGMLGRSAAKAAVENPGAAAAFTAAAAPTLAQQMFGGGASASKESSAKSFYDDEESGGGYVAPSVPLNAPPNTRSGLFGGFGGGGGAASVPKTNGKMEAPVTNSKMSAPVTNSKLSAPVTNSTSYGFPGENDVRDINPFMS